MRSQSLLQLRALIVHPTPDRCVIDIETTLLQQLCSAKTSAVPNLHDCWCRFQCRSSKPAWVAEIALRDSTDSVLPGKPATADCVTVQCANPDQKKVESFQPAADSVASLTYVPLGRLRLGPRFRLLAGKLPLVAEEYRILIRECARDVRAFPARIGLIYETRKRHCRVYPGPHQMADGRLQRCTRTHACIDDIRNFVVCHPWATVVERQIFADAWAKEVEFADRTPPCSCRTSSVGKTPISPPTGSVR